MTRSRRYEFKKQVKRDALKRSGGLCEAVGEVYGLDEGKRCNAKLSFGLDYDHYPLPAADKYSDTLDNCVAVCRTCHKFKSNTYDTPMQAKGKRISDKHLGITRPKQKIPSRPFGGHVSNSRDINEDMEMDNG